MKSLTFVSLTLALLLGNTFTAISQYNTPPQQQQQQPVFNEQYGNTVNIGVGVGYFEYAGYAVTALHLDYEVRISKDFTLAPFINVFTFQDRLFWGDAQNPFRYYHYREADFPVGAKGTYYFDDFLGLNPNWDLYLGASVGLILRSVSWQDGNNAQSSLNAGPGPLYMELHIGTEYHISHRVGIYLDLSTNVSSLGLSIHRTH